MAGEFKLTYNPKVEAANKVREGLKGKVVKPIVKTPPVQAQSFMQQMMDKIKNMPKPKVPGGGVLKNVGGGLKNVGVPAAAATVGVVGATKLAESAGRPGQSRFSMFGADFKGDAPVYSTPLNGQPKKGFADLRGSKTPGSDTPADTNAGEGDAMDGAGDGNGYPEGVVRPMDYTKDPGKVQPAFVPEASSDGNIGDGERTSPEGVAQYGQTLGGLNTFNKGFLGEGYDLVDIKSTYQSEALPATLAGVTQLEKPLVEGASPTQKPDVSNPFQTNPQLQANYPEGTKPFASTDTYTPYKTGDNPNDAREGASPKPDRVERLRQVAFNGADFSGDEPDDSSLVSPMYANKKRNEIRRTFLDYEGSSVKAAVAANTKAGYGKDSNGNARFNYGGELVNAKEGMEWKAKDAAMRGVDPSEFLQTKIAEVKDTPDPIKPTEGEEVEAYKPAWKTTPVPDSGAPKGGWDKHFADMEKNR